MRRLVSPRSLPSLSAWVGILVLATAPSAQKKQAGPPTPPAPGLARDVDLTRLAIAPAALDFGAVSGGSSASLPLTLENVGFLPFQLQTVRFELGASGNSAAFTLTLDGRTYAGGTGDVARIITPPLVLARGQQLVATLTFTPVEEQLDLFTLRIEGQEAAGEVQVSGLGGHAGDPYLHVVIDGPDFLVDYDLDGSEGALLDGSGSHTHEPGHSIAGYEWRIGGSVVSTASSLATVLSAPDTDVELVISDDNVPPRTLGAHQHVLVASPDDVPGVLAFYYDASASGATALIDAVPAAADFVEQRGSLTVGGTGQVGGSPFTADVLVRLVGRLEILESGQYTLAATGGVARKVFLAGTHVTQPLYLVPGEYDLDVRFAVDSLADLPLDATLTLGGVGGSIGAELLSHDETTVVPVIHAMTETGGVAGGEPITLDGFGFFPASAVVVHWGGTDLAQASFTSLTPTRIQFLSPPGGGAIAVSVENGNGASNVRTFIYQPTGPVPIQFRRDLIVGVPAPTAGVWGPDGKLYVASLDGRITALEFDEHYELVSQATFTGVSYLSNHETLGLAIDPYDPPSPVRLYVAHGDHFVNGGSTPTGPSPYTGQVSVLTGPGFAAPSALITGLPVSNHDHAINGIVFDHNGDLLISVGGNTNAGVPHPLSGDLPESPLSAAVLKAKLSEPGFDGTITYVETLTGLPNDDQRFGEQVEVAPGADIEVHATGIRNAYGLVYTTTGRLYATDNGPNIGFGAASTGPTTQGPDPGDDDELDLVEWGNYYGHPNRNRGRTDARQNVYYAGLAGPPSIADTLFQMIAWLPPSSDGIDEYRADTFQGQMRGNLVVQKYQNKLRRVRLKSDGRGSLSQITIDPLTGGLGCISGPGGAIVSFDFGASEVEVLEADDLTPLDLVVHDVFPWRAPAGGGTPFTIGGRGFGTLANTAVTIGGNPATLTEVSWGRIRGLIPAESSPTTALLDVVVTVGGSSDTLPFAFRYLLGRGEEPGRWERLVNASTPIGEVAAGVIGGIMYVVGEGTSATLAYDVQNRQWLSSKATRPFTGHHHAAEVLGGKLYLIGGLENGSDGRLQIYDPATNSWSTGADMPWSGGSVSTAVIGGKIYAAGGIVSTFTVGNCAVYDPGTNAWTSRASMPDGGRNHAAAGTDGTKLYVIGGRRGGNFVANGYDSLMVYDPTADAWTWSGEIGSTLAPLPEARGGMGKAVWLRGELYVFGGETLDDLDANANGVYDRVDVYDPLANTWRREAAMPNPRHGIFPVLFQGHVFLPGGGTQSGNAQSAILDTFTRQ